MSLLNFLANQVASCAWPLACYFGIAISGCARCRGMLRSTTLARRTVSMKWVTPVLTRGQRLVLLTAVMAMQFVWVAGCATIQSALPAARAAEKLRLQTQEWQARGMRFADEYVGRVFEDATCFRVGFQEPDAQRLLSDWTLTQSNSAYTMAAGPSPFVNILDPVTLAVLSRMVVEDSVIPRFPEQGAK